VAEAWRMRRLAAIAVAGALALAGCGDGGDGAQPVAPRAAARGQAALARAAGVMQRKGTAEFTLTYTSDGVPSGQKGIEAQGAGTLDFRRSRARYRIHYDEAPGVPAGATVDLVEEGSTSYTPDKQGRYLRLEEPGPVANATADVFKYLASDTVGVHEVGTRHVGGRACTRYEGKIDFGRIRARTPPARRAEFDRTSRGIKTQDFSLCIDEGGVVREYGAEVRVPGGGDFVVHVTTRYTRVGSARPLPALRASQKA
jgi:hypothetical protein